METKRKSYFLISVLTACAASGCGQDPSLVLKASVPFTCGDTSTLPAREHPKFPDHPRFLVAGQSNSTSPAQNHPPYYSQLGLALMNDPYGADPTLLRVPTASAPFGASIAWIYMADKLAVPMTIFNVGQPNTSTRKWRDYLYKLITNELSRTHYDAILWIQGESDVGELIPGEETCANLKFVIKKSLEIQPDLDWYVAVNSQNALPKDFPTRLAEMQVAKDGYALQGPDTDWMREVVGYVEETQKEFAGEGLRVLGELWANILQDRF